MLLTFDATLRVVVCLIGSEKMSAEERQEVRINLFNEILRLCNPDGLRYHIGGNQSKSYLALDVDPQKRGAVLEQAESAVSNLLSANQQYEISFTLAFLANSLKPEN